MTWYYHDDDGNHCGPVSSAELKWLARIGAIKRDTPVWKEGSTKILRARQLKGLLPGQPKPKPAVAITTPTPASSNANSTSHDAACPPSKPAADASPPGEVPDTEDFDRHLKRGHLGSGKPDSETPDASVTSFIASGIHGVIWRAVMFGGLAWLLGKPPESIQFYAILGAVIGLLTCGEFGCLGFFLACLGAGLISWLSGMPKDAILVTVTAAGFIGGVAGLAADVISLTLRKVAPNSKQQV